MPSINLHSLALGGDAVGRLPADSPGERPKSPGGSTAGPVVFVPYGAPGDKVVIGRINKHDTYSRAWLEKIETPSPQRVTPLCPLHFTPGKEPSEVCGGCDWQHIAYEHQKAAKRQLLVEALQKIGRIAHPNVEETVGAASGDKAWRYRNKVQIPFALDGTGKLVGGFYAPGSHKVVPFEDCPVQPELSVKLFRAVRDWFRLNHVSVYDHGLGRGWLRHLVVRTSSRGEALAVLVTGAGPVPRRQALADAMRRAQPRLVGLYQNVNTRPGNVVLGSKWHLLDGSPTLDEELLGLRFRLSPGAFFQINHAMAQKLYGLAVEMAAAGRADTVWELYSGLGAMGQLIARHAKAVLAAEENPQAVKDGIESAARNGIFNMRFYAGPCEEVLNRQAFRQSDRPAAVVLDPPRAGAAQPVLRAVLKAKPSRIVYVSCDPATLARDARYMSTGGYHLKRSVPVDLFHQTSHVESVSLFEPAHG